MKAVSPIFRSLEKRKNKEGEKWKRKRRWDDKEKLWIHISDINI